MFPLHQIAHVGVSQSRGLRLFGREVILQEFQPMSSRYLIVTDGQTHRQTDESNLNTALCTSASRGKNERNTTTTTAVHLAADGLPAADFSDVTYT